MSTNHPEGNHKDDHHPHRYAGNNCRHNGRGPFRSHGGTCMTGVFTEGMDQRMGLLVTLLGFAVSFVVRPLGGMILGPLGDRVGRRKVLFFTMWALPSSPLTERPRTPSRATCPPTWKPK